MNHRSAMRRLGACTAGFLFAAGAVCEPPQPQHDSRLEKLEAFFNTYDCPPPHYVTQYVRAADHHSLDYRLLPAISVTESTCGSYQRGNNHWGWSSADYEFSSVPYGIEFISTALETS